MAAHEKSWFKFDGTINWPFLVVVASIVVGAIGFGNKIVGQIDNLNVTMAANSNEFKALKQSVDDLRLEMVKQESTRATVSDHEARIRALELRK